MPRKKKDGRFINYYIDRTIYERLERYAEDKSQQMTTALERILDEHLSRYEAEVTSQERYCPGCHLLVRDTRCPRCGKKWLEAPLSDDYCFLIEKDALWSGVLEDCLKQNSIPCLTQSTKGAGLTAKSGAMFDTFRFFVPYSRFYQARDLADQLFSETGEQILEEDLP